MTFRNSYHYSLGGSSRKDQVASDKLRGDTQKGSSHKPCRDIATGSDEMTELYPQIGDLLNLSAADGGDTGAEKGRRGREGKTSSTPRQPPLLLWRQQ